MHIQIYILVEYMCVYVQSHRCPTEEVLEHERERLTWTGMVTDTPHKMQHTQGSIIEGK